jgi:DnaJ-class molecular chaperone
MTVQKAQKCPVCHGLGRRADGMRCARCQGKGEILIAQMRQQDRIVDPSAGPAS